MFNSLLDRSPAWALALGLSYAPVVVLAQTQPAKDFPGIGRAATPAEVKAWDIDVRPDFQGLAAGSGTVRKGMEIWEAQCASCHGIFGESNEVFTPLVGGTTRQDIKNGRVARLTDDSFPGRTTLMKLSSLSSLWDYINRAMPWNKPKSLTADEVYAVTAYMLHLGDIMAENETLSDQNIRAIQERIPNRKGKTTDHGMWPGRGLGNGGKPDAREIACVSNCAVEPKVASFLPDYARDAHGNLAEQNRLVGPQRGADTTRPARTEPVATLVKPIPPAASPATATNPDGWALSQKHACTACHGLDNRIVGPSLREVARKYAGRADGQDYLAGKVKAGGQGVWGSIPMPAQALSIADANAIAQWLMTGAKR
jgi:S-disulfanyl-L-cysteine oxidoreductase SoxD